MKILVAILFLVAGCKSAPAVPTLGAPQDAPETLSAEAEARALLFLKPDSRGYVGHPPSKFSFGAFIYSHHDCHDHPTQRSVLVCTACYTHPESYLGRLSVECPKQPDVPCSMLLFGDDTHPETYGVDPAACE
jgi:hypothetical protein